MVIDGELVKQIGDSVDSFITQNREATDILIKQRENITDKQGGLVVDACITTFEDYEDIFIQIRDLLKKSLGE